MNVRLRYDFPFTAGVYYNGNFAMNNYNLRLWMATVSSEVTDHAIAFQRLKYFIYNCIESTVFVSEFETDQCAKFTQAELNITTTPGDPVDQLIGIMLYYKLNAIMENRIIVLETEISSAVGEYMTYLHCDDENTVGYVQPDWWTSPDLIHSNVQPINTENVVAIRQSTSWHDVELAWEEGAADDTTTGNVVVFADFKNIDETK
jgi:hypothetical protein